jgi:hypothetical protein
MLLPGLVAAGAMFFLTRGAEQDPRSSEAAATAARRGPFPRAFWVFLVGVFLFGLGDFSRS